MKSLIQLKVLLQWSFMLYKCIAIKVFRIQMHFCGNLTIYKLLVKAQNDSFHHSLLHRVTFKQLQGFFLGAFCKFQRNPLKIHFSADATVSRNCAKSSQEKALELFEKNFVSPIQEFQSASPQGQWVQILAEPKIFQIFFSIFQILLGLFMLILPSTILANYKILL